MEKKRISIFFWYMGLMGKRLPIYLLAVLISSIGNSGAKVASSLLVKDIVSAAQVRQTEGLLLTVFLNFGLMVVMHLLWRCGIIRYNIEGRKGAAKVEKLVFSKAMRLPMSYYEQHHSGEFMSKLLYDTEKAKDIYSSQFRRLSAAVISVFVFLIPMLYYNVELTLCLVAISLISTIVNGIFLKPMKQAGKAASVQNGLMTEKLTNLLSGMELARIFPAGKKIYSEYNKANKEYSEVLMKTGKMSAVSESIYRLFDLTGALAFLGLGIWFISKGKVTLGELSAIYTIYGSFRYVFLDIGTYLPQLMNCVANAGQLYDFLHQEEESPLGLMSIKEKADEAISMENISFSYKAEDGEELFSDFNIQFEKGVCTAVTGTSGCGKSTLTKLLLGFYLPEKGSIVFGGERVRKLTIEEARSQIAYVPQEPYLYEVSIAQNIAYGKNNVSPEEVPMEEIIAAAKVANAHEFIMKLPKGYDTIPGERGNTLSGGEKQRIAIARAVIRNAPILLLDEATSALDNESERLINEALRRICKDRTTVMIAHRSSTIAMADRVISLT